MSKEVIYTQLAPNPIGIYSQAIRVEKTVYFSAQAPINPSTMKLVDGGIEAQIHQVFKNLNAISQSFGGNLNDFIKITIFLTNLDNFPLINKIMSEYFTEPYPARAVLEVSRLPANADVSVEGILVNTLS
ncbi:Rid family detoxifying hydrolase [Brenneria goodwinii]|uniref:Rid family detoxifying hydrolase n=1 Tax=Brenneria goodwinii TaxID=1109412 RepID=UPI0036EF7824